MVERRLCKAERQDKDGKGEGKKPGGGAAGAKGRDIWRNRLEVCSCLASNSRMLWLKTVQGCLRMKTRQGEARALASLRRGYASHTH